MSKERSFFFRDFAITMKIGSLLSNFHGTSIHDEGVIDITRQTLFLNFVVSVYNARLYTSHEED